MRAKGLDQESEVVGHKTKTIKDAKMLWEVQS